MPATVEGLLLKIERAAEHLESVREIVDDFREVADESLWAHREGETGETVVFTLGDVREPPPRLGIFTGDFVQNCRAALDHLAWQLVKYPAQPTPEKPTADKEIAFPIYARQSAYTGRELRGATPEAKALIEATQPYHAGKDARSHPLWVLRELSNWDKHRVLHTVANSIGPTGVLAGEEILERIEFVAPGIVQEGAELAKFTLKSEASPEMKVQLYFALHVTFGDGPAVGRNVDRVLVDIFNFVTDITPRLVAQVALDE